MPPGGLQAAERRLAFAGGQGSHQREARSAPGFRGPCSKWVLSRLDVPREPFANHPPPPRQRAGAPRGLGDLRVARRARICFIEIY